MRESETNHAMPRILGVVRLEDAVSSRVIARGVHGVGARLVERGGEADVAGCPTRYCDFLLFFRHCDCFRAGMRCPLVDCSLVVKDARVAASHRGRERNWEQVVFQSSGAQFPELLCPRSRLIVCEVIVGHREPLETGVNWGKLGKRGRL